MWDLKLRVQGLERVRVLDSRLFGVLECRVGASEFRI